MEADELRKNRYDLHFQNWLSVSNVFLAAGLTGILAIWPITNRLNIDLISQVSIVGLGSGFLLYVSLMSRDKAMNYRNKIKDMEEKALSS